MAVVDGNVIKVNGDVVGTLYEVNNAPRRYVLR